MDKINIELFKKTIKLNQDNNFRIKICVNFQYDFNNIIKKYNDNITNEKLLNFINMIIDKINLYQLYPKYSYFMKSNFYDDYGVLLGFDKNVSESVILNSLKKFILNSNNNYNNKNNMICVLGYFIVGNKEKTDCVYLTENKRIRNKYYDFDWLLSINSFQQPNPYAGELIHNIVDKLILKSNCNYLGIGGEMGVYAKKYLSYFNFDCKSNLKINLKYICLTNSTEILNDFNSNINNQINCYLVDYNNVNINVFIDFNNNNRNNPEWIGLINISKHGLRNLTNQINNIEFKQIIYIGCKIKSIHNDMNILLKKYHIKNYYEIKYSNESNYVIELIHN